MTLDRCIELIKNALNKIPHLRELDYDNTEYRLLKDKVSDILQATFGSHSDEYNQVFPSVVRARTAGIGSNQEQEDYLRDLNNHEVSLQSIIQKYEILQGTNSLSSGRLYQPTSPIYWGGLFCQKALRPLWAWITSHRKSVSWTAIAVIVITLLGTNWDLVKENIDRFLKLFRIGS